MAEKRTIQDTERPHWIVDLDAEMKRQLEIADKPKQKRAETSAKEQ